MQVSETDLLITLVAGSIFIFLLAGFFVFIIINNFKKNSAKHKEDIRLIFETQEKEQIRITRDLHDGLGSLLSVAKMQVSLLEECQSKAEIAETATHISTILDQAVNDVRILVRNMVPRNIIEKGWIAELHELEKQVNKGKSQLVRIISGDDSIRFSQEAELNLYRVVQELINNALKHSGADKIEVTIKNKEKQLFIEVTDNGKGIADDMLKNGHGMKNIQSRLNAYKGSIEIKKNVHQGTLIIISFEHHNIK